GKLFTASTTDFRGKIAQISRHFSRGGQDVSQDTSIALLQDPAFVGSAAVDMKLFFFFTEVGKEFSFVDELRIARVAQVCKDDVGGQRTLQNKWTSFAKAPLLCQVPRQLPFNVLQHVFTLPPPEGASSSETLFYGVFTSQWYGASGGSLFLPDFHCASSSWSSLLDRYVQHSDTSAFHKEDKNPDHIHLNERA
ncbi:semaphorin-4B-like, partial [Notothenia coriiceps]|uniref:Semaphorin-4B-like n=1 Tax=Notothenia coriiceps TaxID=8208 RepID=A0A6I9PUH9_9TELE